MPTSGLHGRIILLASLTILPAIVVLSGAQWMARRRALDRTIEESRRLTRLAAAEQASIVASAHGLLRTVSASHLPDDDPAACSGVLADVVAAHREFLNIFVVDGEGMLSCSAKIHPRITFADRTWFQRAIASRSVSVGDYQIGRLTQQPGITVAFPKIEPDGTIRRVYAAAIDLAQLSSTAASGTMASGAVLTVLDRNHTIILRYPDGDKWVGKQAPASGAADRIRAGAADDVRDDYGVDGIRRLWTTVPVGSSRVTGLTLALGIPTSIAFAEVNALFRETGWLLLLVIVAGGVMAWFASERFVVRPLSILTDVTRRLSRGDFGARAELASAASGVRQLADSVNEMAIGLESRWHAEEQLRQVGEQLRQSQKMEAVGQLAGGIAHDFNNLLTVILGSTELLLEKTTAASVGQELRQIRAAGMSAAKLTRQLLAFSRKQILQPKVVDINEVLVEHGSLVRRVIGEDVQFVTRLAPGLDRVYVDRSQLEQVVLNLAVNARDAMPKGGTVTIETRNVTIDADFAEQHPGAVEGPFVRISLIDTGVGMDDETKARVFEPFFTTKGPGKGTGLGLATVYGIVKQSGGYVFLESAPGRGTTFHVDLPRTLAAADAAVKPAAAAIGGSETVLLVEDEAAVRAIARRVLSTKGYRVLEARNGREAIEIARAYRGPIHLLLTDVIMPELNGVDVATQVVAEHDETCVLFMSGYPNQDILRPPMKARIGFVEKPFLPDRLLEQVRALLASTTEALAS